MLSWTTGKNLVITIGGGSHEKEMTLKMQGLPAGYTINTNRIFEISDRRKPGKSPLSTPRKEADLPLLAKDDLLFPVQPETTITIPPSGILEFVIKNENHNSKEYNLNVPRPGHADLPAFLKYRGSVNMAGGGPFSGRMTAMTAIAGAVALELLSYKNIEIGSEVLSVGKAVTDGQDFITPVSSGLTDIMKDEIKNAAKDHDSVGGIVSAYARGLPAGIGGPGTDGIETTVSGLLFAIPAVKGVEFGNGFNSASMRGSENNDPIISFTDRKISTETNNSGGILGGMSTGMPLVVNVAFKPTPSVGKAQRTVMIDSGLPAELKTDGRHDPCIVPRGRVVVEAALATGLLDLMLEDKNNFPPLPEQDTCEKPSGLKELREKIDSLDDEIIRLLNERMDISVKVAEYKKEMNISVKDSGREDEILNKAGKKYEDIYREIFRASRKLQHEIKDGEYINKEK